MTIERYIPNFFSGYGDEFAEVFSKEELLKVPFVARWAEDSNDFKFLEFCISDNDLLLAFLRNLKTGERTWYVVAKIMSGKKEAVRWFNEARYEK